jgi:hypothetical protein
MDSRAPSPQEIAEMWEAGARSLAEGWRQGQEFWNSAARNWAEMASTWTRQPAPPERSSADAMATWRELQEAAFAVAQAWMRLPLLLGGAAKPGELQEAVTQLGLAQGRAYKLWLEALTAAGAAAARGPKAP